VTGAVPLPYLPAAGTLQSTLGLSPGIPACSHPMRKASSRGRGLGEGHRCPLKGLTLPTIARIATVRDSHREAAVFGRRLPPRALNPHVVRIAPLHDASITTCPKAHAEICTLGRSYHLMHAEELRAGHVLWPEPMNVPCVHDLGGFVKPRSFALSLSKGCLHFWNKKDNALTSPARTGWHDVAMMLHGAFSRHCPWCHDSARS